jgi:LysM repeat protein
MWSRTRSGFYWHEPLIAQSCLSYNDHMKKSFFLMMIVLSLLLSGFVSGKTVRLNAPGATDVIAAVNALRASQGLAALEIDGSLMAAAQVQAEYLASIGGSNITDGHKGAGGTYAYERAAAAGYPLPQGVEVKECWAYADTSNSIDQIINGLWNNAIDMEVMLHKYGKNVGAGVFEKDGIIYYILDVSVTWGVSSSTNSSTPSATNSTPGAKTSTRSTTPQVVPVIVSTPKPDGSLSHVVQPNQAIWSIARAYGVSEAQIRLLNNFATDANNIYVGETLVIRLAFTPTPSPTATITPRPPTRTPVPPQVVGTLQTVQPVSTAAPVLGGIDRTTIGLLLVLLCGIGLVLIIMGTLRRKK